MNYKKLSELADIKFCSVSSERTKLQDKPTRWLACANFLKNNSVIYDTAASKYIPDKELLICPDDIIVKRIAPTFVNYIDCAPKEVYAGNNLIIITPKQAIYSKYLAMILNDRIETLSKTSSVGAVMKSISRQHLENLQIPFIPYEKQIIVGELWYNGIELEKMKNRLAELETIKQNYQIKKYVQSFGGNQND